MHDFNLKLATARALTYRVMAKVKAVYATNWPYWVPVVVLAALVGHWL